MTSNKDSYSSKKIKPSTLPSASPDLVTEPPTTSTTTTSTPPSVTMSTTTSTWSGFETIGMRRARCSLLLQDELIYDAIIKQLPKQRVHIDRTIRHHAAATGDGNSNENTSASTINPALSSSSSSSSSSLSDEEYYQNNASTNENTEHEQAQAQTQTQPFHVDFDGATILQLQPSRLNTTLESQHNSGGGGGVMPTTITVAGKCVLTPENYIDFHVMMRTKQQSYDMNLVPNGSYDWPDITSFLLCPVCGNTCSIPRHGDRQEHEYWMTFYPLIQIAVLNNENDSSSSSSSNSNNKTTSTTSTNTNHPMVLCTRTICRLTCLDCMDDLLEGLSLNVIPGGACRKTQRPDTNRSDDNNATSSLSTTIATAAVTTTALESTPIIRTASTTSTSTSTSTSSTAIVKGLSFSLPASDILAEAGSVSFLEGGPPRPDTHHHLDDIVDAWTLYSLWESSGAWEALQNDFKMQLSKSLSPVPMDTNDNDGESPSIQTTSTKRNGQKCGNDQCCYIHGKPIHDDSDELCRLCIKCQDCHSELYCSKICRDRSRTAHADICHDKRRKREDDRREHRRAISSKYVQCNTCSRKFSCTKMKKCSACRHATYCSVDCQKMDWVRHKSFCKR